MSNAKVSDCKGNFFDSENGLITGNYDHNEDYIFTICVPGAASIELSFSQFCTEQVEDYLIIYDGGDTTATKLSGKISGSTSPGTFRSSDSCLTIYFHSDVSVPCTGWEASWTTKVKPILPPKFVIPPNPSCEATVLRYKFDQLWNCDSISSANFTLSGVMNASITNVKPINCNGNNETDSFELTVSPKLDRSGLYQLDFDAVKYDRCDSAWQLHSDTTFSITDCPIYVNLIADPDTVCNGTCTDITAEVTGGDSSKYVFDWTPLINGTFGPNTYCPTSSGWVKLTVSDGISVPGTDSIWIEVVSPPVAQQDTTVCESVNAFVLNANPSGGLWRGQGITDSTQGIFNPTVAQAGAIAVEYWFAGCSDTVVIDVIAFDAGPPDASCPGGSPFNVTGFNPSGGTWSGPNITSGGLYDPQDTGSYVVTYSWNGCVDTKTINVYPVFAQEFDTVCQSADSFLLNFSPIGGVWSGSGIGNPKTGYFHPNLSGHGDKQLVYDANGCRDTTNVFVKQINARWNQVACPDAGNITVIAGIPSNGYWTGQGIVDSLTGEYDPSFIYALNRNWINDTLEYHVNGCSDKKVVYVRQTIIYNDTLNFCIEDSRIFLDWNSTRRSPGGGTWSGPGVSGNYFTPLDAGHGVHTLYYDAYGCVDSIIMVVHPASNIQKDTIFCETDLPYTLFAQETGGTWFGNGITDTSLGVFDPIQSSIGFNKIYYFSKFGCIDSTTIEVGARPIARITKYDPTYCLKDSNFIIEASPLGGVFYGTAMGDSIFNPKLLGSGNHKIKYTFGTATCNTSDSVNVIVLDTLKGSFVVDDDSLCFGESGSFLLTGLRGSGNPFSYSWSNSSSTNRSIYNRPNNSGWIYGRVSDGCSDEYFDSVYVHVFPKIEVDVLASDTQCLGTVGWAEVNPRLTDPYSLTWNTSPPKSQNRINVSVGNDYYFTVQNQHTKCVLDSFVYVPSYSLINAYFITSPAEGICLNPFNPELRIINYTVGGITGTWYYGDSSESVYDPITNPSHYYEVDTNRYTIWLFVENEGGCKDSFSVEVCVDDSVYLFSPTAFSPGNDGVNDLYHVITAGVVDFEMAIYNRWGEKVFGTRNKDFEWDGSYMNRKLPSGYYPFYIKYKGKRTVKKIQKGVLYITR